MKKYKIDFIENPDEFTNDEMQYISGGDCLFKGVCIVKSVCGCKNTGSGGKDQHQDED